MNDNLLAKDNNDECNMMPSNSVINLGEISKPATVLIEKISGAVGAIFEPRQIRRVADAKAYAETTKAVAQIEIWESQQRAMQRFLAEETRKQDNIETIIEKALPLLEDNAQPQDIEDDWIANFFDKSKLISDDEMQVLWSKVLAGEANSPGTYSKRTVNFLGSLDKSDAILFQSLCNFVLTFDGNMEPFIYDCHDDIYNRHGVKFESLMHLQDIGLVTVEFRAYMYTELPKRCVFIYFGNVMEIELAQEKDRNFSFGQVRFTRLGKELAGVCNPQHIPEFMDYILCMWVHDMHLVVSSPLDVS